MSSTGRKIEQTPASPLCPWCHGELILSTSSSLDELVPGGVRARAGSDVPPEVRSIAAWVCQTPHCRYRRALGSGGSG
jgi:hypothetical protein